MNILSVNRNIIIKEQQYKLCFTQQLANCSLVTQINAHSIIIKGHNGSQHSEAVAHLCKLVAKTTCSMETVTLTKERICGAITANNLFCQTIYVQNYVLRKNKNKQRKKTTQQPQNTTKKPTFPKPLLKLEMIFKIISFK